jgi:hypothetical protein
VARQHSGVTGNGFRDLIAAYIHHQYRAHGLVVYREVNLGKTIIAKDRQIDVFVMRPTDQRAIAIECKYQDVQGSADEKIRMRSTISRRCGCRAGDPRARLQPGGRLGNWCETPVT